MEMLKSRKRVRRVSSSDSSEAEYGTFANGDFIWKQENLIPKIHNFSDESGATVNTEGMSRSEVFELFFNDELVKKVILETNNYGGNNKIFTQITEDELKVYIALNILMSIIQKPSIKSYWSVDKSIETPFFKNIMSRKRFLNITTNLHFASNTYNSTDPLEKIGEVSDMITKNFIHMYKPHKNISVDESLLPSVSYLHIIPFVQTKQAGFGVKFYKLCDSETRYIHNFKILIGKYKTNSGSVSGNIVINLMKESDLLHKGHCLYVDSQLSSPSLYLELHNMQTNVCGIVRLNKKGIPKELKSIRLEKSDSIIFATEVMAAIKWKDKDTALLTTMHSLDFSEKGKVSQCSGENCLMPTAITDYNKNIGGVDIDSQMISTFHTMRRCKETYLEIFFYFVDMMLLNSYILFKVNEKDQAFHIYKQKLAEEIIAKYLKIKKIRKIAPVNDSITRYTGRHFPTRIPPTEAKGRKTSKRCKVCLSKYLRRETVFKCDICDVPLCVDHFKDYHTN